MSLRAISLRARLLIIMLALVAAGLSLAGWATNRALRDFLVQRVDSQLASAQGPVLRAMLEPGGLAIGGRDHRIPPSVLPSDSLAQIRSADGTVVEFLQVRGAGTTDLRVPPAISSGYSTVDLPGQGQYRLLEVGWSQVDAPLPIGALPPGGSLVVGIPLKDVNDTLGRLLLIEIAVGAATLVALSALALWLVRVGLRPLEEIGETADAIAAGDLSRRVKRDDERTEIGRLGRTLNGMLARIEEAFAERRESERRLRRFVADASHELQTPLTSVRGYAELFRRGAADNPADLDVAMRRIEAEATRMGVLVDDLLLLAHLDQGRRMGSEDVDLTGLVADLVQDARVVEPGRPIELRADGRVSVRGDDHALRQVVANLLSNARAHTPAGTPVTVTVATRDQEAVVEVADAGPGLPPEHAAKAFERFFRADPSRARASGGSGLGLSIVAAIAEAHGGRAEVDATPGGGATFRVLLPLTPPPAAPEGADPGPQRQVEASAPG